MLVAIHGELYDLTEFAARHPGGALPLRLAAGSDATDLFEMYHTGPHAREVLHQYRVNPSAPSPPAAGAFSRAVQGRAAAYFTRKDIDPKASVAQLAWYAVVTALFLGSLVFYWLGSWPAVFGLAVASWFVFGMGHDGAHFAVSRRPWVNRLAALGLLPNMNVVVWYHHHTLGHHVRTNCPDDPDHHITYPFIRSSRDRPRRWWHRFQPFMLPVYFLLPTGLMAVFGPPVWLFTRRALGVVPLPGGASRLWGILSWLVTTGMLVGVPLAVLPTWKALVFPLVYLMTSGMIFSLNVFASHLSADCAAQPADPADWARVQVEGTINWRSGSWLASRLSVGVNHQIEHHLFPGVNPQHYHRLSPVVREVCREFGVTYQSCGSLFEFVAGSVRWVATLARE